LVADGEEYGVEEEVEAEEAAKVEVRPGEDSEMAGIETENGIETEIAQEEDEMSEDGSVDIEGESEDELEEEEQVEVEGEPAGDDAMEVDDKATSSTAKPVTVAS
jgi:histone chaperone ASF1